MNVWFTSDLHLGHKALTKYRTGIISVEQNTEIIFREWKECVRKRDLVWVLGDVAFSKDLLMEMKSLPGIKKMVRGNHDNYVTTEDLLEVFQTIEGLVKYKGMWLSHCPIHEVELYGKPCLHGHTHNKNIYHPLYFNCCVDNLWKVVRRSLISLDEIRGIFNK